MNRDFRNKHNQQNTRDRRKNLRLGRHHKEIKRSDQREQQIKQIFITNHSGNVGHNKKTKSKNNRD